MHTPKLCRHAGTSQGYVTLSGREHYLGPWPHGQKKPPQPVQVAYDTIIAKWLANGRRLPDVSGTGEPTPTSVNEIIIKFFDWAKNHYAKNESGQSGEIDSIRHALAVLTELFGRLPIEQFGPRALKTVRKRMVEKGWARTYINHQVNRLRRMVRWGVGEELVPPTVLHGLSAVGPIRRGEPNVRESGPVKPVPDEFIELALPFMPAPVAAMVRVEVLSGARPGEIVRLRGRDIDRSEPVWAYRPDRHKNAHRGHGREIWFGPKAQAVLLPWLRDDPDEFLFNPAEAEKDRAEERSRDRVTPRYPSHMARNAKKRRANPKKAPGTKYTTASYARAIRRACELADRAKRTELVAAARAANPAADVSKIEREVYCPEWSPGQLRHNAGTAIRKEFGIEMAQLALGHASMTATQVYAERDRVKVMNVFAKVG